MKNIVALSQIERTTGYNVGQSLQVANATRNISNSLVNNYSNNTVVNNNIGRSLEIYNPYYASFQSGDYLNSIRIVNRDGSSNMARGTGYITIDNRPYLNGSRPSFRKDFEYKLYDRLQEAEIPYSHGGTGTVLEPFTVSYPEHGKGGAFQLIPTENINIKYYKVELLPNPRTDLIIREDK